MTFKKLLDTLLKLGISFLASRGICDIYHSPKKEIGHSVHTDAFIIFSSEYSTPGSFMVSHLERLTPNPVKSLRKLVERPKRNNTHNLSSLLKYS